MEYSSELKKNFATAYLAEEYERLEEEKRAAESAAGGDPDLLRLAKEDVLRITARQEEILAEIEKILAKEREEESKPLSVVMEFRAGAGGNEAAIFAKDLKGMYEKFAAMRGWRAKPVDELTFEIAGGDAYDALRYETGVHRVQRIPETEKSGRIHTSTASVAVLPIRATSKIEINPADIEMEFSRSGGGGGANEDQGFTHQLPVPTQTRGN